METVIFGDLLQIPLRNGLTKPKRIRGEGFKMVNMGELFAHNRITDIEMERVPMSEREQETYFLEPNDLLFARQSLVREGAGKCSIFITDKEPVTWEGHIIRARLDTTIADPLFYYYLFSSKLGYDSIQSIVEQVAAAGIRGSDLAKLNVPYFPLSEQRAIAHILGSLDDKIELNRQMNQTLEEMARAIFKSWFVDFDPVHAKARGEQPVGMDADTAALFPDSFEETELGLVPSGWQVGVLQDIADIIMGVSPKGDTYNEDGIGTPLINGPVEFGEYFPNKQKWTTAPTRLSADNDLILCVRGSTTGRRVVADGIYCLGRGVCAIRSNSGDQEFINRLIDCRLEKLLRKASGSVFPNLGGKDIKTFRVLLPDKWLIHAFSKLTRPFAEQIRANVSESRTLAELRDTLLPKLMSGELRVSEALEMAEALI